MTTHSHQAVARRAERTIRQARAAEGPRRKHTNVGPTERLVSGLGGAALAAYGLSRGSLSGLAVALAGGALAWRGATGFCSVYHALGVDTSGKDRVGYPEPYEGVMVRHTVTVNRSPEDCYDFWRKFENFPRFMTHLVSVRAIDDHHSHWEARAPLGRAVAWDAETINDLPGQRIAWRSIGEPDVRNAGSVAFRRAPGNRGTEVTVELSYEPPAGTLGRWLDWTFGEEPEIQVREDLRRFKQLMEAGEIPTTTGQTSCRR
jgi:uncharacterized membrane protein